MKFFTWGSSDETPPSGNGAPSAETSTGGAPADAISSAREKVATRVRSKQRPAADAGSIGSDNALIQSEIAKQLESCYDPKAWGALLGLPADAAHALTARDYWKLSREERDTLGATGSAAARTLMITNPRGLAFLMVGSALFSIYLPRAMKEMEHLRRKRKNDAEKTRPEST